MLSIVIPIYNIHKDIVDLTNRCLKSIKKYTKDYEIIIIDNKNGEQWKKDADIYIKNEKNNGNGAAWNQGAKLANGEYLVFSDNDIEILTPNWFKYFEEVFKNKKTGIVFPITKNKEDDDYFARLSGFFWAIKKELFNKVGKIDENFGIANFEDSDIFCRVKNLGYELTCTTKVKVKHYSRATCDRVPEVQQRYEQNEKYFFSKHPVLPLLDKVL